MVENNLDGPDMDIFCAEYIVVVVFYSSREDLKIINMIARPWNLYLGSDFHVLIFKIKHVILR